MPYISKDAQERIRNNWLTVNDPGELNFLLTGYLIKSFAQHPKYEMIHILRQDFVTDPRNNTLLKELKSKLSDRFTTGDIYTAAAEAFFEFRSRVGAAYELKKRELNGDLPEYEALLKTIAEIGKP